MNGCRENSKSHSNVQCFKSKNRLGIILISTIFLLVLTSQCAGINPIAAEDCQNDNDIERLYVMSEILSAPSLTSPDDGTATTDATPTFVWESVVGAESYFLQLDITTSFDSSILINATVSSTLYTPISPLRFDTWYWRVAANDSAGDLGEFSDIWSVTVEPPPPTWDEVPMDQTIEYGDVFYYDLNATGEYGIHHYWIGDSIHFAIDDDGVMTNAIVLEVGEYWIEVRAYDPFYHYCDAIFRATVVSAAPPQWVEEPENQYSEYGDHFYYNLNATDFTGLDTWWINDTVSFSIDENGVIENLIMLEVGVHGLEVRLNDSIGYTVISEFSVLVQDKTPPNWVGVPTDRTAFCWFDFIYDLNAEDISGLHTWWLNDTVNFSIDTNGIITNATFLTGGLYGLEVFVNDTYGNVLRLEFSVDVKCCPNPPISINSDDDFASQGWPGSGTSEDPYVIADQVINMHGLAGSCIAISNTRAHLVIQNCSLAGARSYSWFALNLNNVSNVLLLDNEVTDSYVAIHLLYSSHVTFRENNCTGCTYGFFIEDSSFNELLNNTMSSSGYVYINYCESVIIGYNNFSGSAIHIYSSLLVSVFRNDVASIDIDYSPSSAIFNNTSPALRIQIYHSDQSLVENNTCQSINLYYSSNCLVVDNMGSQIYLSYSSYNTIVNAQCSRISLTYSHQNMFSNIICSEFSLTRSHYNLITKSAIIGSGFNAYESNHNVLSFTNCSGSYQAIRINYSYNITLTNNTCFGSQYGLYIYDYNSAAGWHVVVWNIFIDNGVNVRVNYGHVNIFDFNYYSDYSGSDENQDGIGDIPHPIPGAAPDAHPLIARYGDAPIWMDPPTELLVEFGSSFLYDLDATAYIPGIDSWWLNDTARFSIDDHGVLNSVAPLPIGTYGLQVWVSDTYGNTNARNFTVVVQDTLPPEWIEVPESQRLGPADTFRYDLNATDPSGIHMWWISDSVNFTIDSQGVISNVTSLSVDYFYTLQVWVNDTLGLTQTIIFSVLVIVEPYLEHSPIFIDGDDDFVTQGWPGSGTSEDPYRIEFLKINCSGIDSHCIFIRSTRAYFIISNCYLSDALGYRMSAIYLYDSQNGEIVNNTCVNNYYGIYLQSSHNHLVSNNNCTSNTQIGMINEQSNDNRFYENTCHGNLVGLYIYGARISVMWNLLVDNTLRNIQATPEPSNIFSNNYYSDYIGTDGDNDGIGDIPYNLGYSGPYDYTPLMLLPGSYPIWLETATNQLLEVGTPLDYDLEATACIPGIVMWSINDTAHFSINSFGTVTNVTFMYAGVYGLHVWASDANGNTLNQEFTIIYEDTTPPSWVESPVNQVRLNYTHFIYDLNVSDLSGIDTWWINNTDYFHINFEGIITNSTALPAIDYWLRVNVSDTEGNMLSVTFLVSIKYTPNQPVLITCDNDFLIQGWSGSGTISDPYRIENLYIDLHGLEGNCIEIRNTRAYFIVYNCDLMGAFTSEGSGIFLLNVTHAQLIENNCTNNVYGIYMHDTNSSELIHNSCSKNTFGISLHSSYRNLIIASTCVQNSYGIELLSSDFNVIHSSNCSYSSALGIALEHSDYNTIRDNTCHNNYWGISLLDSHSNSLYNNTCSHNIAGGMIIDSFSSFNQVAGNSITSNHQGISLGGGSHNNTLEDNICRSNSYGIYLWQAINNTLVNNSCSQNSYAIYVSGSYFNTFTNNTCVLSGWGIYMSGAVYSNMLVHNNCSYNGNAGILLYYSTYLNTLTNNTCEFNNIGIDISWYSWRNIVTNNTCNNNTYGIRAYGYGYNGQNHILWNVLVNNTVNAQTQSNDNIFEYNYYSDYAGNDTNQDGIGDTPHPIAGGSPDLYPLMLLPSSPPSWLQAPTGQIVEIGTAFRYDLNATASPPGIDSWWLGDTDYFVINDWGVIVNITFIPADVYQVDVFVKDTLGRTLSATFDISIIDTTPPIWLEIPCDQNMEFGSEFSYELRAADLSDLHTWRLNDTEHFIIDGSGILSNAVFLSVQSYGVQIWVNDTFGNTLTVNLTVIVADTTAPSLLEDLVDQIIEFGNFYRYDLNATDLSGLDIWWLNNSDLFSVDSSGVIINVASLNVGSYGLMVFVNDTYDNTLCVELSIIVQTPAPPSWLEPPSIQRLEFGSSFYYDLNATDISGLDWWSIDDTEQFSIDGDGVITSIVILPVGVHILQVWVSDSLGHVQTAFFDVVVTDTTSPEWIAVPSDQVAEYGHDFLYELNAIDLSGLGEWSVDNALFAIDWAGRLRSVSILSPGSYGVIVSVSDIYGNPLHARFKVSVVDTTPPEWSASLLDQTLVYGERLSYQLMATDLSGLDSWWLNDTMHFKIDTFGLVTDVASLLEGSYGLKVWVNDTHGNVQWGIFRVEAQGPESVVSQLDLQLSGSFDFLLEEKIHFQLAALLRDAATDYPLSGATVTATIYGPAFDDKGNEYDDDERFVMTVTLVEEVLGSGVYIFTSEETMKDMELEKGIYLVYCSAILGDLQTIEMIQFHIDPPGESESGSDSLLIVSTSLIGVFSLVSLITIFVKRRKHS